MAPHQARIRPRFYELDPYGHVNHSVYIQYFESARIELLSDIGYGLDQMQTEDMQLVVIRLGTRFIGAAGLLDELQVETGLVEAGRVKCVWAQRIVREGNVITTQLIEFATTNNQGKPRRLPTGLAEAMEPFTVAADWLGRLSPSI